MIDIKIDIDRAQIKDLERKMGNLKSKAPTVLARAINRAAGTAKTYMKKGVNSRYFITQKVVDPTLHLKKANSADLSATVTSEGKPIILTDFKVNSTVRPKRKGNRYKPSVYKAGVKKSGGTKPLSGDPKPFGTGKYLVVRETKQSWPLQLLFGPSVPSMLKNDEVISQVKEKAAEMLERRIDAEVNNILQGGR